MSSERAPEMGAAPSLVELERLEANAKAKG